MAFTDAQKVSIRKFLGYPQVYVLSNPRLENAIDVIGGVSERQTYVAGLLGDLDTIDTVLAQAGETNAAYGAIKKADEVEFYDSSSSGGFASNPVRRAQTLVSRLSTAMGVPLNADYFGRGGYRDDSWASYGFQVGFPLSMG